MNHLSAHRRNRRRPLMLAVTGLAAAGLALLPATLASAHVRVTPDNPTSGGYSALTFRVPNESDTAGTVKVAVELPQDTPFVSVSSKPVPGWTVTAPKEKLPTPYDHNGATITEAVQTVTWTAENGVAVAPGQYQEFSLSVGPLPAPGEIMIPATQTYSDGTVVAWDEPTPASGEEPERPAPVFEVLAAAGGSDDHGGAAAPSSTQSPATDEETPNASANSSSTVAVVLGGAGLAVGLVALVLSGLAWRRSSGSTGDS